MLARTLVGSVLEPIAMELDSSDGSFVSRLDHLGFDRPHAIETHPDGGWLRQAANTTASG